MTAKRIFQLLGCILIFGLCTAESGCDEDKSADAVQRKQQETILQEGTAEVGMPAIKNFRERKLMKDILELRDQNGLVTYTYTYSEMTGVKKFLCNSVGYGLPYATQFTNPQKVVGGSSTPSTGNVAIPSSRSKWPVFSGISRRNMGHV